MSTKTEKKYACLSDKKHEMSKEKNNVVGKNIYMNKYMFTLELATYKVAQQRNWFLKMRANVQRTVCTHVRLWVFAPECKVCNAKFAKFAHLVHTCELCVAN